MIRSSRADVRNPVMGMAVAMAAIAALSPEARRALRTALLEISTHARTRAERSWRTNKPPMAAYWKAVAVYARHIAYAIGRA